MKFRNGFVSNSSSSSYIVSVPKGFTVSKQYLQNLDLVDMYEEFGELGHLGEDDEILQSGVDLINNELASLAEGKTYHRGDWRRINVFWTLREILKDNDMIMMTLDGPGGDGEDIIKPFKDNRKKK